MSVLPMARSLAISGPAVNSAAASTNAYKLKIFALLIDPTQYDKNPCSAGSSPSPKPTPNIAETVNKNDLHEKRDAYLS